MNYLEMQNMMLIASAPVIDPATLRAIEVTPFGKETAAHIRYNRQTLAERIERSQPRRQFCDTSCAACKLCNAFGEPTCSDCREAKEIANATRIDTDR